jgi:uncharacterized cupin superfamily protein
MVATAAACTPKNDVVSGRASAEGGGPVIVSRSEVCTALSTTKALYVGAWTSRSGRSTLTVAANGTLRFAQDEGGITEVIEGPIEAFTGDDIVVRKGATVTIKVTQPPRFVGALGGHYEMSSRGLDFERFP